jgi:hypothetical protein
MLPNTLKARTPEELQGALVIPIIPFKEPPDRPDEITFPWKEPLGGSACRIQVYSDDFEIFQQWDPWYIHLGFFGCLGSCLLAPFTHRTQGLRHLKTDILKLEFGPFRKAKIPQIVKRKPEPVCRLYVKTAFDPNVVAPAQGEKVIKYVFWLGEVDGSTEETRKRLDALVIPELQTHVEQ